MKYLILFCCLFFGTNCYSQSTKSSINFLKQFFADKLPIVYSDRIYHYDLKYLEEAVVNDTLNHYSLSGQNSTGKQLILTKEEKRYLLKKIDEQQDFIWPNNLFENSKAVDLMEKSSKQNQSMYNFSKPVFIRNNSICIFYYGYYCGGECGEGIIEIHHKVNGKWTAWISIPQWIS